MVSKRTAGLVLLVFIAGPIALMGLVVALVSCLDPAELTQPCPAVDTVKVDTCVAPACYPDYKPGVHP